MANENAAHIINTSTLTRFDFKGLAAKVAQQLCTPKATIVDDESTPVDFELLNFPNLHPWAERFAVDEVFRLRDASRLGGADFLKLIVEHAESLTVAHRRDLPDPVDPNG